MRLAFVNAIYNPSVSSGSYVHIDQFIKNVVYLGHEIWTMAGDQHPLAHHLPENRFSRIMALRNMDIIYIRIEYSPPYFCRWGISPNRQIIGSPKIVWEFNTIPEFGKLAGQTDEDVQKFISKFRYYGKGCDLAVCVSNAIADYIKNNLQIDRILVDPLTGGK